MQKEMLDFGTGSFVGQVLRDPAFFETPIPDQAKVLGWVASCPVVNELIDPLNPEPGRGPESMRVRYGTVNFWFGELTRLVSDVDTKLYDQLMTPVARREDEPPLKFEADSVPESYLTHIPPMCTLPGFALPRLFIEQIGIKEDISREERARRMARGISLFSAAAENAYGPEDLLTRFAESLIRYGNVDPKSVLKLVYSKGWLEEQNAKTAMRNHIRYSQVHGEKLTEAYRALSPEEKEKLEIVDPDIDLA